MVKGINWYGTEHKLDHPPFGLDKHSMSWYFKFLKQEQRSRSGVEAGAARVKASLEATTQRRAPVLHPTPG